MPSLHNASEWLYPADTDTTVLPASTLGPSALTATGVSEE